MSDEPKKPPMDTEEIRKTIRGGIKSIINGANSALSSLQGATQNTLKPLESTWKTIEDESEKAGKQVIRTYNRRKEYPNEIIGASTLTGAVVMGLRRGKVAGLVGGAVVGSLAYATVYDKFDFEEIPDIIFGRK